MTKKPNHVLGFLSQLTSRLGIMAISILSTAILARLLSPSEFGIVSVALAIVALADAIFDGAFAINIVHKESLDREYTAAAFNISLLFSAVLGVLLFASAGLWERIVGFPHLASVLRFLSLTLVIKAAGMVSRNLLVRSHRLHALSISAFSGALIGNLAVGCGLAFMGFGIWSLIWGTFVAIFIETLINVIQARPPISLSLSRASAWEVFSTGSLYTMSQMLNWCMNSGSSMVSARAIGPTDFGFYSRGNKLLELTTSAIGQPLMRVFFPSFARMKNDPFAAQDMLRRALAASSVIFAMASALLVIHSHLIVEILLGSRWGSTAMVGQILFLSLLPRCCYKITESAAFGLGGAGLAVKRQAIFAVVAVGAVAAGSHWSMIGIATGVATGIWLNYIVSLNIAAGLVGSTTSRIVAVHIMPISLAIVTGLVDLAIIRLTLPLGEWPSQMLGALSGGTCALFLLLAMPARLLPVDIVALRRKLFNRASSVRV